MALPDFSKIKTEFDYLLWLVIDSNPEVAKLRPELIEFGSLDEKYSYTDKTVSVDLIYRLPGKPPAKSTVTYNRGGITQFCSSINMTGNNTDSYGRLTYEADRIIVRECRAGGLDIDPVYIRYNLKSTSASGKTDLSFDARFNTLCLYGSIDVKMNSDASRFKTLAQCLTQKVIGQLSARDLSYYGKQYGNGLHADAATNEQLKIIYGAIIKKNPALTGITQATGSLARRGSYTWDKINTEFIVKDPVGETEVYVTIDRYNINPFINTPPPGDYDKLKAIPSYLWTVQGVYQWIISWLTTQITQVWKMVPPRPGSFELAIYVDGKTPPTDSWLNKQTNILCPLILNDLCYQGGLSTYYDKVYSTVESKIDTRVLVGVLKSDVTA